MFFDQDWSTIGSLGYAGHDSELASLISLATRIPEDYLSGDLTLSQIPISVKMSWARRREASKGCDMTYSLVGIFEVEMDIKPNVRRETAFRRLVEKIIKTYPADESIYAWGCGPRFRRKFSGMLPTSPNDFNYEPGCELRLAMQLLQSNPKPISVVFEPNMMRVSLVKSDYPVEILPSNCRKLECCQVLLNIRVKDALFGIIIVRRGKGKPWYRFNGLGLLPLLKDDTPWTIPRESIWFGHLARTADLP